MKKCGNIKLNVLACIMGMNIIWNIIIFMLQLLQRFRRSKIVWVHCFSLSNGLFLYEVACHIIFIELLIIIRLKLCIDILQPALPGVQARIKKCIYTTSSECYKILVNGWQRRQRLFSWSWSSMPEQTQMGVYIMVAVWVAHVMHSFNCWFCFCNALLILI